MAMSGSGWGLASEKMHKQEQHRILINAIGLPNDEPARSAGKDATPESIETT